MKIALPIAHAHPGTTGEYMAHAFRTLGHQAEILTQEQFVDAYSHAAYELFFCVDSGEPLQLEALPLSGPPLAMWFIDFRHNKNRAERIPNDLVSEAALIKRNAFIFQAQYEDFIDSKTRAKDRAHWLPVGADPDIWCDIPTPAQKNFHLGFIGNVWDVQRKNALEALLKSGLKIGFPGHGAAWKEDAAQFLRASLCGFNISSFYGTDVAYDINMRFFETLSCGIPLITNWVPSLEKLLPDGLPCVRTYRSADECLSVVHAALNDQAFLATGHLGRQYILDHATYRHRAQSALSIMQSSIRSF